jgi:acyl-coenzyme A thioesterase PaaI-like protein
MQSTTTHIMTNAASTIRTTSPKPGFRVSRWLASAMNVRPEPKARASAPDFVDTRPLAEDEDDGHGLHGGWHASSLDLAAGLQVVELGRGEAEELMQRHFQHLRAGDVGFRRAPAF